MAIPINFLMSVVDGKLQGAIGNAITITKEGDVSVADVDKDNTSPTIPGSPETGLSPGLLSIPSGLGSTAGNNNNAFGNNNVNNFNSGGNLGGTSLSSYESLVSYFSTATRDINTLVFGWTNTFQDEILSNQAPTNSNEYKQWIANKLQGSRLIRYVPSDGDRYGITTGSVDEWANYFTALAIVESSLNPGVVGDEGQFVGDSNGLYQLSPNDALNYKLQSTPFTKQQLFNPDINASAAIKIHESLLSKYGSIKGGAGRYWGPIKRDSSKFFNELGKTSSLSGVTNDPSNAHIYVMEDATVKIGLSLETKSTFSGESHSTGSITVAVVGGKVGSAKSRGIGANPSTAYVPSTETSHQTIEDEQWNSCIKIIKAFKHVFPHGNVFGADELGRTNTTNSPVDTIALTNQLMSKTPPQPGEG